VTDTPQEPQKTPISHADYMDMVHALEFQIDAGVNVFLEAEPVNRFESHISTQTFAPEPQPQHQHDPQHDHKLTAQLVSAPVNEPQSQNDDMTSNYMTSNDMASNDMASYDLPKARPVAPAVLRETTAEAGDISAAENAAEQADTLDALKQAMEAFEGCALKRAAKNTVFSDGDPASKIMLVGEAPGRDEDREGKPFIGRSGKLLDKMFAAIGLNRNDIYITNLVPWRPTGNRTPTPDETALCRPFLLRHIELVQPDILVLVGGVSAKEMLDSTLGITKLRGSWQDINIKGRDIPALPILHPAYLLRNPARKAETWQDLCSLQKKLSNTLSSEAANLDGTD